MKKVCSIVLLLAMLLSLAVVGTFGTSAADATLTATKATVKPVIDGTIDAIWETATAITFMGNSANKDAYVKILWDDTNLYILAVCPNENDIRFEVIDRNWTASNSETTWSPRARGLYIDKDGTTSKMRNWGPDVAHCHALKVIPYNNGFIAELSIPKIQTTDYVSEQSISFAACLGGIDANRTQGTHYEWDDAWNNAEKCAEVKLIDNPGLPQKAGKTIAMHGVQTTVATDGKFDARFVAEIASLDYAEAGFEVSFAYDDKTVTKKLNTTAAYTSVLAAESTVTPTKDGNYLVAVLLTDIPADADITMTVKPYTVSGEATAYGNTGTVKLTPTATQSN